ncbi:MAG: HD domain-containing protein [Bacteroidota bacterium]
MQYYNDNLLLLKAIEFSANKHQNQRRKGSGEVPYINHPVKVARILAENGASQNMELLVAAILHDTIEDTDATPEEITTFFGESICKIVLEVTDDKSLEKPERKALQILNGPHKSDAAKALKIADKIANLEDILNNPPDWDIQRKLTYFDWAKKVVDAMRGPNPTLEALFDRAHQEGLESLTIQNT